MTARDWLKEQREIEWTLAISGGPDEPCVHVKRTALLPVSSFAKAEQLADGAVKALKALESVLELHQRAITTDGAPYCKACNAGQTYILYAEFPCPTVAAITSALEPTP